MTEQSLPKNIADTLPGLSEEKYEFIERHLGKKVREHNKLKWRLLAAEWSELKMAHARAQDTFDLVASVFKGSGVPEDLKLLDTVYLGIRKTMADVQTAKFKNYDQAKDAIHTAKGKMVQLAADARAYVDRQSSEGGRDLGAEAEIAKIKLDALSRYSELVDEFRTELKRVLEKMREESGGASVSLPVADVFYSEAVPCKRMIEEIPQRGDGASVEGARTQAGKIIEKLEGLLRGASMPDGGKSALARIEEFDSSACREIFVAQSVRRGQLDLRLRLLDEKLAQLSKWDCPDFRRIKSEADQIRNEIPHTFFAFDKITEDMGPELERTQNALSDRAQTLVTQSSTALGGAQQAFGTEQARLMQMLEGFENELGKVGRSLGSDQRQPILDQLAVIRNALEGMGGCNVDSLKPVEKMLAGARQSVGHAQNIGAINEQIKTTLVSAKTIADRLKKDDNPLSAEFNDYLKQIGEFAKQFKKKPINEALSDANKLLSDVEDAQARNAELVRLRADNAKQIEMLEVLMDDLNTAFAKLMQTASRPPRDYAGSFHDDLSTIKNWNATKTDLAFNETIRAKIGRLRDELVKARSDIEKFVKIGYEQSFLQAQAARERFDEQLRELNERRAAGENVDALMASARKEMEENALFVEKCDDLLVEMGRIEMEEREEEEAREKYLADAQKFITDTEKELKDKQNPLRGYKDEIEPQVERVRETLKLVKAGKPGATGKQGLSELGFVMKFVDSVRARGARSSVEDLGRISIDWTAALMDLHSDKGKLVTAVSTFEDTLEGGTETVSDLIDSKLDALISRAESPGIDKASDVLANSKDRQERKAAREAALSEVRRIRRLLLDDPVFQKCVLNPFKVPVGSGVSNRLYEIELNVLRGV